MAHAPVSVRKKTHNDNDIHKFQGKESFLTSQISLFVEEAHPKIPDGGWGWMVVLAAFVINGVSEGISFSFGLLYSEFLVEFKSSKSATSWIGSLFIAMPLLAGPIGSALVNKYGCISMTILGSLICASGFIMSVYVDSLAAMYVTFGVIGGVGRCLTFVTAVVSIAFWFEKNRAIALGLAASGTGVGTIVFAPLTNLLLNEFHWRGTLLNLSGGFLNMCVCGVMMREPDWIKAENQQIGSKNSQDKKKSNANKKQEKEVEILIETSGATKSERRSFSSAVDLPTYLKENEKVPQEVVRRLSENKRLSNVINVKNLEKSQSSSQEIQNTPDNSNVEIQFMKSTKHTGNAIPEIDETEANDEGQCTTNVPLIRNSSFLSEPKSTSNSYLQQIKAKKNSLGSSELVKEANHNLLSSSTKVYGNDLTIEKEKDEKWYHEFLDILRQSVDFSMFAEFHFFLLALSTTILFIWFVVPYFYLVEHMIEIGYTDGDGSLTLTLIGITNTIGMIFFGWAGEKINIPKMYAICLIFCGISVALIMLFSHNYWLLMVSTSFFGLTFASCFSLVPSLLGHLVPLDKFTLAYGLILLCMGVGNLTGPPLAGWLYDITKSWELSFYMAAVWIIISGILIGIIPFTEDRKMCKRTSTTNRTDICRPY